MALEPRQLADHEALAQHSYLLELLLSDASFQASTSFREQCYHACRILRAEQDPPVPFSLIGKVFQVDKGTVRKHARKYADDLDAIGSPGRPPLFTPEQIDEIVKTILYFFEQRKPLTLTDIRSFAIGRFARPVNSDTLRHILHRDPRLKTCTAHPIDERRLQVTDDQIQEYFANLLAAVSGAPAHFVFNMDEMGHQAWADAHDVICFVPRDVEEPTVSYPVSRTGKRITLIACIAADGSYLRPSLIIPRKTFDDELLLFGFTPEKVEIYSQTHSFIDIEIFNDWFRDSFIPELVARRQRFLYTGPAFLIVDNCTAHRGQDFDVLCQAHNVLPIWLPPHSSNQLQPLDLCIFGVTKRFLCRANKLEKVNLQTGHIVNILESFMTAAIPRNIIAAFRNAGISLLMDADRTMRSHITPETTRCVLGSALEQDLNALVSEGEMEEEEEPNIDEYMGKMWSKFDLWGDDPAR
jgi:hypothetical protein